MNRYFIFLFFLVSSCQPNNKSNISETDCNRFKKGIFYHHLEGDPRLYKIERSDSIQKETLVKTGDYVNLKIEWTGACEYELTFLDQHIIATDSIIASDQQLKLKVKITKVTSDSCFIAAYKGDGTQQMTGVIYIDKK